MASSYNKEKKIGQVTKQTTNVSEERRKKNEQAAKKYDEAISSYKQELEYARNTPVYSKQQIDSLQNQYAQLRKDFGGNWDKDALSSTSNSILGSIQSLRQQNEKRGRFKDRELENYLNGLEDYVGYVGEMTSTFDKRTDYNRAVRQSGYHDKYEGLSRDELRDVTHQLIQSNGGKKNEEVDWLLNYMNSDEVLTANDLKKMSLQEQRRADTLASSAANKYRLSSGENADKYAWMSEYGVDPGQVISTDAYTQLLRSQGAAQQANSLASQYRTGAYWKEQQEKYGNLSNSADFTRLSQYDPGIGGTYDLVMRPDKAARVYSQDQILPSSGVLNPETLSYMSDEDRAKFSYLWRSQGEKAAMEFLNNSARYANSAAQMADIRAANKALGGSWATGIPASIGSVPINLMSGTGFIDAAIQNARNRANPDEYRPVDYNSPGFMANAVSSGIREGGTERWNSVSGTINIDANKNPRLAKIFNGKGLGDAYQLTMSMADSGAIAALGGGFGTILLGGSAATQGILDAVERGATDGQALTMGFLNGAFETAFEYMSIDHLLNKLNFEKAWQQIASQAFAEGSEEFNTTLFNTMADILVMAQNSEYMQNAQKYIEQGKTPEEAQKQALADFVVQIAWDAIGGALSGGVMGAGHFGFERITQNAEYKQLYNDGVTLQALVNEALELDSGNELANKLKGRDSARGGQIRRLLEQNDQAIQAQDRQAIRSAAENRLREVGETENVAAVAAAVTKSVTGENLTKSDRAALLSSRYGQSVINELRDTTGEYDWTGSINTERINVGQYNRDAFMREDIADVLANGPMGLDDATARAAVRSAMNETLKAEEQALIGGEDAKAAVELARAFSESPDQLQTYRMLRSTTDSNGLTEGMRRAIRAQENAPKQVTQTETQKAEQARTAGRTAKSIATGRLSTTTNSLGMQSLLNMRNETQDDVLYENGVRRAYEMAQAGMSYEDIARSTLVSELTDAQLRAVYSEGRNNPVKVERPQGRSRAARGTVRAQGTSLKELRATFNDAQKTAYNLLSSIAEATGLNIVLYKSGGTGAQGMFKASDNNTVYVDVDAGLNVGDDITDMAKYTMLRTFTHEFTHFIERWSSDAYNELREVVFSHMDNAEERVDSWMLRMAEDKGIPSDQRYDRATREVVAEGLVDILPETQFIQDLYENHRNIFQKLWDQLKSFLADIKAHFAGMGDTTPEARALKRQVGDTVKYFDDIVKAFDKAAKSAVENMNAAETVDNGGDGDVQYDQRSDDYAKNGDKGNDSRGVQGTHNQDNTGRQRSSSSRRGTAFNRVANNRARGNIPENASKTWNQITKEQRSRITELVKEYAESNTTDDMAYFFYEMRHGRESRDRTYRRIAAMLYADALKSDVYFENMWYYRLPEIGGLVTDIEDVIGYSPDNDTVQYESRITPEQDAEYLELAKDPDANEAELKRMVEQAARAAGYDMHLYHGSRNGGGFTVFKNWQYFTGNRAYAERYQQRDNASSLYDVYVKSERMFDTRNAKDRKVFEQFRKEYGLSELQDDGLPDWTDGYDIADFIEENDLDYDGIVLNEGGDIVDGKPVKRGASYVIRQSEQVKSADPVTYDDDGNVIPLTERFNSENEDIRFQERTETITNRDLLVNALDTVVGTEQKKILDEYRAKVSELNDKAQQLADIRSEIHDTMFTKGGDRSKLAELNNRADILQRQIDRADKRLTNIEAMEPIKRLLESERNKARKAQAEKGRETLRNYRESRSKTELRQNIRKVVDDFARRMDKPTERRYIPREFMPAVIELMEAIDTTTPRTLKDGTVREMSQTAEAKANALNTLYDRLQNDDTFKVAYDPVVHDMVRKMVEVIGNTPVNDMSMQQLRTVYDTLRAVRKTISEATKLKDSQFKQDVFEVGSQLIRETRDANLLIGNETLAGLLNAQLSPDRFFERLAGFAKDSDWAKVGRMFSEGTEKSLGIQRDFYYLFRDLTENKNFDSLTSFAKKNLVDIGLVDDSGNTVSITRGMMLSVYMHLLNEDNIRGVMYGGLSVPVFNTYYAGKVTAAYGKGKIKARVGSAMTELWNTAHEMRQLQEEYDAATDEQRPEIEKRIDELGKRLDEIEAEGRSEIDRMLFRIEKMLTPYERELIQRAQEWYDHKSRDYINETTMRIYGIKKAGIDNYYTIHRDTDFLGSDFESISRNLNLENWGNIKERVPSQAPILLTDICYELDNHVQSVAKYVGYVSAQKNFSKIWSTTTRGGAGIDSVKNAVGQLGKKNGVAVRSAQDYIENYIGDIVGGKTQPNMLGTFRGYVARGSLTLNLRVALSQAASIPTAAAEVGWGSMARGFIKSLPTAFSGKAHQDLAHKSVYFWQRYRGEGGMREFSEAKGSGNRFDRLYNKLAKTKVGRYLLNWCQDVDVWSTYTMWAMAEDWIQHNTDMKPGSEGYDKAVEDKYNAIIRKTQPNYTTTERSDMLRNKSEIFKTFTMFKTQPNQNLNILYEATARARRFRKDFKAGKNGVTAADVKSANAGVANAYTAVLVGAPIAFVLFRFLANAAMQSLSYLRDDDDELTAKSVAKGLTMEYASSLAGMFLYGGQIYDFVSALMTGGKYYGPSEAALDLVTGFGEELFKVAKKAKDPNKDVTLADWEKLAHKTMSAFGVPYSNVKKMVKGIGYWIEDAQDGTLLKFEASADRTSSVQYNRLFKALNNKEKYDTIYNEMYQMLTMGGKTDKEAKSKIKSELKERVKEMYQDGGLSENDAIAMLTKYDVFDMDKDKAYFTVKEWQYNETKEDGDDDFSRYGEILDAVKSGKSDAQARNALKAHGYYDSDINTEISEAVGGWYKKGEITEQQARTMLKKYAGKYDSDIDDNIRKWTFVKDTDMNIDDVKGAFIHGEINEQKARELYQKYGLSSDKIDEKIDDLKWEKKYGYSYSNKGEEYKNGNITRDELIKGIMDHDGKSREDAANMATVFDWQKQGIEITLTQVNRVAKYEEYCRSANVPIDVYNEACDKIGKLEGKKDENGKTISGSVKEQALPIIDALPLTNAQKDAIYLCSWKASTLNEAPWH